VPASLPTAVLPLGARVNPRGHLEIGGCDLVELAREYGTPLYVYDELTLRTRCRAYVEGLRRSYPDSLVLYASKAYSGLAILQLVREEGLGVDVVSGGELYTARAAGVPMERVYFHGNNKTPDELELALDYGVGRVVVDSFHELELLDRLAAGRGRRQPVLLRVGPGVEAHTHEYRKTGILDTKFGFPIATGQAAEAVARALRAQGLELVGLHTHIGSQIFELEPYAQALEVVAEFAAALRAQHGWTPRELSPGGGWGIAYTGADHPPPIERVCAAVGETIRQACGRHRLGIPRLVIEPGRSIVGPAGVALYTVGATKDIPGVRRYVSLDGGMADNIRPALYGAQYTAIVANRANQPVAEVVTLAGKYCESGDLLIKDVALPRLEAGDVVALPASGAYNLAMSSNYNQALKPAVVLVSEGRARVIRRRQRYEDLLLGEEPLRG